MKYDVATNFDEELINYIKEIDSNHEIVSLYGKLKYDCVGGGRPADMLNEINMDYLESYNRKCNDLGIEFNYLLNPLCLGGKDVNSKEHFEIIHLIEELKSIGITAVTVNSPYLCEIIKEQFPNIKVTIGIYAGINSLMKVKQWVALGADGLTLVHDINRNFKLLEHILEYLKGKGVFIRLIANNGCLHQCPFEINHGATISHVSVKNKTSEYYVDYSLINCYYRRIKYISNLISSDWIRPEDIHVYEEVCEKVGNKNLVIKLVERTKTTDYLKNVIKAYLSRQYEGNLNDLLNWPNQLQTPSNPNGFLNGISDGDINLKIISKYFASFNIPVPYIDNNKLDGFINHFIMNYNCNDKLCWNGEDVDILDEKSNYCKYCYNWAKKVVVIPDENKYQDWIKNNEELMQGMVTSEIFKGMK